jgi:hypothetical protein
MAEQFSGRVTIVDGQGREVFQFDAGFAVLDLGALGNEGDLRLRGDDGEPKIHLDGGRQLVNVTNAAGVTVFRFDAANSLLDLGPSLGGAGNEADLRIFGDDGEVKIHLDGGSGDIRLTGADCAEQFDTEESQELEPGSVMTIGEGGRLRPCFEAYDRRVAGVVSGAGSYSSGIVLDSRPGQGRRAPLALTGKAYCRVDAGHSPVEVGDLLTTSATVGHAMKATDPSRAFGATVGKALQPLGTGVGLIPILVALQ